MRLPNEPFNPDRLTREQSSPRKTPVNDSMVWHRFAEFKFCAVLRSGEGGVQESLSRSEELLS
jgi:hypothetical protein